MWVKRKEWDELTERIAKLENQAAFSKVNYEFTVYPPYRGSTWLVHPIPKASISVKDVLSRVIEKLGIELTYVAGQPERVVIETPKKKAAA